MNQPPRRGEEFPMEELDGLPDWNASAWERIKVRNIINLPITEFQHHVEELSREELGALRTVLDHGPSEQPVRDAIAAELAKRDTT